LGARQVMAGSVRIMQRCKQHQNDILYRNVVDAPEIAECAA